MPVVTAELDVGYVVRVRGRSEIRSARFGSGWQEMRRGDLHIYHVVGGSSF